MNIADETLTDYSFLSRYHYLNQRIIWKDDIEFVTEFPCLLGHPVSKRSIADQANEKAMLVSHYYLDLKDLMSKAKGNIEHGAFKPKKYST